jgi:hypothetical protein
MVMHHKVVTRRAEPPGRLNVDDACSLVGWSWSPRWKIKNLTIWLLMRTTINEGITVALCL